MTTNRISKDVESLLVWAFCDQMVHKACALGLGRMSVSGFSKGRDSTERVATTMQLGTGISTSMNLGFEAPYDAYVVQDAVALLPEWYRDVVPASLLPNLAVSSCLFVDRAASRKMDVPVRDLVLRHAITGTRPDFRAAPARLRAVPGNVVYHPGSKREWYCQVGFEGDTEEIILRSRTEFLVWRLGLEFVRDRLRADGLLRKFHVSDALPQIPAIKAA